jgi:hypothetical protein
MMSFSRKDIEQFVVDLKDQRLGITITKGWRNFCDTLQLPEALVINIKDIESMSYIFASLHERNKTLNSPQHRITARFAAGKEHGMYNVSYSITKLLKSDVILRYVGEKEIKIVDAENHIVEVSGFYQIGELNKLLYEQYGLVIPTASLIPYVTVAGLAATASHGTGRDQPNFPGLIVAMTILKPDGKLVTIKKGEPLFETICSAHLGLFGVIVSVQLQCAPRAKLECQIKARSLPKAAKMIDKGLFTDNPYVEWLYMPTYGKNDDFSDLNNTEKKNVSIRQMRPVSLHENDKNNHPLLDYLKLQCAVSLSSLINFGYLLSLKPDITRFYMNYFSTPAEIGKKDSVTVGPWYDVWHHLKAYPSDLLNLDLLVPISADGHELREIVELIDQKLVEYAEKGLFPINLGIYMRYFKGTAGALSTSAVREDQHVLGLDFAAYKNTPGADQFMAEIAGILTNAPYYAKPHWGKNLPSNVDYKQLYPKMDEYVEILEKWHEDCGSDLKHSAFLNKTCCDILQLPKEYYPEPPSTSAEQPQRLFSQSSNKAKAVKQQQAKNDDNYDDLGGIPGPILCNII